MNNLTLSDWSNIAQVATAVITLVGVFISMWLSTKALREVQLDRKLKNKPHLAFENGGWRLPIEFIKVGHHVVGYDPKYMKEIFSDLPEGAESIGLKDFLDQSKTKKSFGYGRLRNHGGGTALATHITWVPQEIWIGAEHFDIDDKKKTEPVYHRNLNTWPALPSNIQANGEATINCLPTFITKDVEKKIKRVNGVLEITCKDVFDSEHVIRQEFYLFTYYRATPPAVHVTFSDIIGNDTKDG